LFRRFAGERVDDAPSVRWGQIVGGVQSRAEVGEKTAARRSFTPARREHLFVPRVEAGAQSVAVAGIPLWYRTRKVRRSGLIRSGRYWARTSDLHRVEVALSQLS
jgi:hypothetical protein